MRINKNKPENWKGEHILLHRTSERNKSEPYAMYCNVVRPADPKYGKRIYVMIFGQYYWSTQGTRFIYVEPDRIAKYSDYFKE